MLPAPSRWFQPLWHGVDCLRQYRLVIHHPRYCQRRTALQKCAPEWQASLKSPHMHSVILRDQSQSTTAIYPTPCEPRNQLNGGNKNSLWSDSNTVDHPCRSIRNGKKAIAMLARCYRAETWGWLRTSRYLYQWKHLISSRRRTPKLYLLYQWQDSRHPSPTEIHSYFRETFVSHTCRTCSVGIVDIIHWMDASRWRWMMMIVRRWRSRISRRRTTSRLIVACYTCQVLPEKWLWRKTWSVNWKSRQKSRTQTYSSSNWKKFGIRAVHIIMVRTKRTRIANNTLPWYIILDIVQRIISPTTAKSIKNRCLLFADRDCHQ